MEQVIEDADEIFGHNVAAVPYFSTSKL